MLLFASLPLYALRWCEAEGGCDQQAPVGLYPLPAAFMPSFFPTQLQIGRWGNAVCGVVYMNITGVKFKNPLPNMQNKWLLSALGLLTEETACHCKKYTRRLSLR